MLCITSYSHCALLQADIKMTFEGCQYICIILKMGAVKCVHLLKGPSNTFQSSSFIRW